MKHHRSLFTLEWTEAEILRLWPTITHRANLLGNRQDIEFADRIMSQRGRPGWTASPMQLALMRSMRERHCPTGLAMDPDLNPDMSTGWTDEAADEIRPCVRCNADGATLHITSGHMLCAQCAAKWWR